MNQYLGEMALTVESEINKQRVLHNGELGVYEDLTPVHKEDLQHVQEILNDLHKHLISTTDHHIHLKAYGAMVNAKQGNGKAFVGYDEGVDSKLRLCYATDTFLAMELQRNLQSFGGKKNTSNQMVQEVNLTKEDDESNLSTSQEIDYGWGTHGKRVVVRMLEDRIKKVGESLRKQGLMSDKGVRQLQDNLRKELATYTDNLTTASTFTEDFYLYPLFYRILEEISPLIPESKVTTYPYGMVWESTVDNLTILHIYDKELGKGLMENKDGVPAGNISIGETSPSYVSMRKLFDYISSNIGYKKLQRHINKSLPSQDVQSKKERVTVEESGSTTPNESNVINNKNNNNNKIQNTNQGFKRNDYFDIYLTQAGQWGKEDNKYANIKATIEAIVEQYDVDGVSLRGIDNTEVIIDWVIDKQTYTMALTHKATRVKELECLYGIGLAYDIKYPEVLEELIQAKLEEVL